MPPTHTGRTFSKHDCSDWWHHRKFGAALLICQSEHAHKPTRRKDGSDVLTRFLTL